MKEPILTSTIVYDEINNLVHFITIDTNNDDMLTPRVNTLTREDGMTMKNTKALQSMLKSTHWPVEEAREAWKVFKRQNWKELKYDV